MLPTFDAGNTERAEYGIDAIVFERPRVNHGLFSFHSLFAYRVPVGVCY